MPLERLGASIPNTYTIEKRLVYRRPPGGDPRLTTLAPGVQAVGLDGLL